jgi:hypothetical protein
MSAADDNSNTATTVDNDAKTPEATAAAVTTDSLTVCPDQLEWLDDCAVKIGGDANASTALRCVIDYCNAESLGRKKNIFMMKRCFRCSQASMGGKKVTLTADRLQLASTHRAWLVNVRERCDHESLDKTLRIVLDFYASICRSKGQQETREIEKRIFKTVKK